ncbi:MAG: DUF397 domain-containing protein [Pseudonocardiaceae bacterium]
MSSGSELTGAGWRRSSRSGGEQTDCVEVAEFSDRVAMRDSKNPAGPILAVPRAQWRSFLTDLRVDRFR